MSLTLYGLKNCDTCKKALKALEAAGRTVEFVDIRAIFKMANELIRLAPIFSVTDDLNEYSWRNTSTWQTDR